MTTPRVTEIPARMAAVEPDPFAATAQRRLIERQASTRRLELVRGLLRNARNAGPLRRTVRTLD
jgi:hypothetical protein